MKHHKDPVTGGAFLGLKHAKNMHRYVILLAVLCFLLFFFWSEGVSALGGKPGSAPEEERKVIHWVAFDYTPVYIRGGPFQGMGPGDILLDYYQSILPEYQHRIIYTNVSQIRDFVLDASINTCIATSLYMEEALSVRRFGLQNAIHPPFAMITTVQNMPQASHWQLVSLDALLSDAELYVGLPIGRSYPGLEDTFRAHYDSENILIIQASTITESLYNLMLSGEFHYTIGLPMEPSYIKKISGMEEEFIVVPIAGSLPKPAHPNCTNNEWGRAIIDRLDLPEVRRGAKKALLNGARNWFSDAQYQAYSRAMESVLQEPDRVGNNTSRH